MMRIDVTKLAKINFVHEYTKRLTSITQVPMKCPNCGWVGKVIDCEPDVDGDGSLGCPKCNTVMVEVK